MLLPSVKVAEFIKSRIGNARLPTKNNKSVSSGTTTFAFYYKDGVMFAADTRTTCGNIIFRHDAKKVSTISKYSLLTAAGTVAYIQYIRDNLVELRREFQAESDDIPLSLNGQAKLLKEVIRVAAYFIPLDSIFILGGYDIRSRTFAIYEFDEIGGWYPVSPKQKYAAIGSGGEIAASILNSRLKNDSKCITEEAARAIALEALKQSAHQDTCSGPTTIHKPTIMKITKDGIGVLS